MTQKKKKNKRTVEIVKGRDILLEALAQARSPDDLVGLCRRVERVRSHSGPVVKHTLGEGLPTSLRPKIGREPKGLVDGQMGFHHVHGRRPDALLAKHDPTTLVKAGVDAANRNLRALEKSCQKKNL